MKHYIILTLFFGCLCLIVTGTTDKTFSEATDAEKFFTSTVNSKKTFNNATNLELSSSAEIDSKESSNNSADFEKSSSKQIDFSVSPKKKFPGVIQYGTHPELQYGLKSKIKGAFKKIKNKVKDGLKKVKDIGKDLLKNKLKDILKNKVKDLLKKKIPIPINSVSSDLESFPYIIQNGTDPELRNEIQSKINATNIKLSSHNAIDLQESTNNSTNLENSSNKTTDLFTPLTAVSAWKNFPYVIQYGPHPELQYGFKSKIKGAFKKIKNKIKDGLKKVKDIGKDLLKEKVKDLLKNKVKDLLKRKIPIPINSDNSEFKSIPYVIRNGTELDLQNEIKSKINGTNLELSSGNAINLQDSSNNSTNLEKSSINATDFRVSPWNFYPYIIQNLTNPELQYGFKSKIKGGFKKIKNKIKGGFKKIKDKAKNFLKNKTIEARIPIYSPNSPDFKFFPYVIQNGTNQEFQNEIKTKSKEMNLELSSNNAKNIEKSLNNSTNLERSFRNATDFNVSPWKFFPYIIQNGTNPELQHGFKSEIKGDFKNVKNKIQDDFNKGKKQIKDFDDKVKNEIRDGYNKIIDLMINKHTDIRINGSSSSLSLEILRLKYFPYIIQNSTDPQLQHGIKSKIKGGFNKVKSKITGGFNKVKSKITDFGNKVKGKITDNSGNYGRYRYRKPTGNNGSYISGDTATILYIIFGTIGAIILISAFAYCLCSPQKEKGNEKY